MNYNYKEIARIINNKFKEREKRLMKKPDTKFARGWAWASDLNKCLLILEEIEKMESSNKYQRWFLKEIKSIMPHIEYLNKFHKWIKKGEQLRNQFTDKYGREPNFDDLNDVIELDKLTSKENKSMEIEPMKTMVADLSFDDVYGLRICLCSATIAYCAQFGLEDFEVFYNIYKEVLRINKLECLIPLIFS